MTEPVLFFADLAAEAKPVERGIHSQTLYDGRRPAARPVRLRRPARSSRSTRRRDRPSSTSSTARATRWSAASRTRSAPARGSGCRPRCRTRSGPGRRSGWPSTCCRRPTERRPRARRRRCGRPERRAPAAGGAGFGTFGTFDPSRAPVYAPPGSPARDGTARRWASAPADLARRRRRHESRAEEVIPDWQKSESVRTRPSRAPCAASTRRSSRAASSPRPAVASTTRSRA